MGGRISYADKLLWGLAAALAFVMLATPGTGQSGAPAAADAFSLQWESVGSHQFNAVRAGDLDGDGDVDFAIGGIQEAIYVYLNDGQGNFQAANTLEGISINTDVALGDLDGDGKLDIVASANQASNSGILVYQNQGEGKFLPFGG